MYLVNNIQLILLVSISSLILRFFTIAFKKIHCNILPYYYIRKLQEGTFYLGITSFSTFKIWYEVWLAKSDCMLTSSSSLVDTHKKVSFIHQNHHQYILPQANICSSLKVLAYEEKNSRFDLNVSLDRYCPRSVTFYTKELLLDLFIICITWIYIECCNLRSIYIWT